MFEAIRRMFGRRGAFGVAVIRARLSADRALRGTFEAFFLDGTTASGPWPVVTGLDLGDYLTDAAGFGADGTLGLAQRSYDRSATAPAGTVLRGGDVFRAPPDSSLRVPNEAIAELRPLLSSGRAIRLEVVECAAFDRWSKAPDRVGSPARRGWIAAQRRGDRTSDDGGNIGSGDGDGDGGGDDGSGGGSDDDRSHAPQDAAAAAALVAAGFVVGSEVAGTVAAHAADGTGGSYTPSGGSYDR